ncbi:RNA polymerase sigma factor [Stieleria marina]|uniref:ECF RNA polymerase sigma factor SigE n=1 Tax=Stieleria marina TaxID=1930275 RepID=A0A517NN26_9BACT|nr:ECF RNA polymerase sigma factor SigE [Planctomycetes bacterium K23_9]
MTDMDSLVTEHADAVWRTVNRVLENQDDARECYQQTFLDAFQMDRDGVRNWRSVLCQIAFRRSMDCLRRRYRDRDKLPQMAVALGEDLPPDKRLIQAEVRASVRRVLVTLPVAQAEAFWLRHIQQLSTNEVAIQMKLRPGHVRVLIHRAIRTLRNELGSQYEFASQTGNTK